jgi:hypothetical protein
VALQNRVTPDAEIIAHPARGCLMGNRGILHRQDRTLGTARWRHKAWISCVLEFKGRHSDVMPTNRYTRLFFLDEAVALAAGHRPCAECRHADYQNFKALWQSATGVSRRRATDMDRQLHQERVDPRTRCQITHMRSLDEVPDGAFIRLTDNEPAYLVWADALHPYAYSAYAPPIRRPRGIQALVLTPASVLLALKSGYRPRILSGVTPDPPCA